MKEISSQQRREYHSLAAKNSSEEDYGPSFLAHLEESDSFDS